MSSKGQRLSRGDDAHRDANQEIPQDGGANAPNAEDTLADNSHTTNKETPPTTPLLEVVVVALPSPGDIPDVPSGPSSQRTSVPFDFSPSVDHHASSSDRAQTRTEHSRVNQGTPSIGGGEYVPAGQGPLNKQAIKQPEPPAEATTALIDQLTNFWEKYNAAGDKEDKEFVASAGGDLDNLLIFAGLFSAIDTAFIIESYKGLKPDPADEAAKLLRSVVHLLRDPSYTDESVAQSFSVTTRDVRVNCLLFTSLCCSLSAAFGAVLAKQWLTQYDQDGGSLKTPSYRGRERHLKYEGRSKWHLEDVIVTLPTLLQFSLFFFLVGLADFIWPLNTPVASVIIAFTAATFLFYTVTISISIIDRSAPFQTRLSALLVPASALLLRTSAFIASLFQRLKESAQRFYRDQLEDEPFQVWLRVAAIYLIVQPLFIIFTRPIKYAKHYRSTLAPLARTYRSLTTCFRRDKDAGTPEQSVESRCVVHLLERMTVPEDLDILAEAVDSLPDNSGAPKIADALATFHLKPIPNGEGWLFPGLHGQSRGAIAKMLGTILGKWEHLDSSSIHYTQVPNDPRVRWALLLSLWDTFLAHPEDQGVYDSIRQIYLKLSCGDKNSVGYYNDEFLSRKRIVTNLKAEAVQERTFCLVCLLPTIGCDQATTMELLRTTTPESPQLVDMLQSTMWESPGHKPDLETFWLATFRVEILSSRRLDTLVDSHFPEYLAAWFSHFAIPDWETRFPYGFRNNQSLNEQLSLYWTYLFSLRHLLKHTKSRAWSQELARTGHLSCLRVILLDYPHELIFCAEPLGLWILLCLWNQEEVQLGSSTSQFLTNDCVQLVAESVKSCTGWITEMAERDGWYSLPKIWTSREEAVEDVAQMLDWLFLYLEAAKQGGLLDEGVAESTIQAYSGWWTEVNSLLPKDQQRSDRSNDLRTVLLENVSP